MSLDSLKLNKQILSACIDAGYTSSKEIQSKTISRILGGQDIVAVGPEGSGKTTALIMGVLMRLKFAQDPPRVLILVPNKDKVLLLVENFQALGKNTNIRILGVYPGVGMEGQREALAEGVDVVVGTPDRIHAIYLKSGINLNKISMFILDDAETIIQQGFQTLVFQIAERLPKCQHLIFSEVYHAKLEQLGSHFLNFPIKAEVSELSTEKIEIKEQALYQVPNFKTKLNLLKLLLKDIDTYPKLTVVVNTKLTVETIYKQLASQMKDEVAVISQKFFEGITMNSVDEFLDTPELRVLISSNEESNEKYFDAPILLHFDVPASKELLIERIKLKNQNPNIQKGIIFATDIELSLISKIEQSLGQKFPVNELPADLFIETDRTQSEKSEESKKNELDEKERGSAFHKKKDKNAKDYNLTYKERLKMFGKKNRKHKRGEN